MTFITTKRETPCSQSMSGSSLRKATGRGFTVLPNRIIDLLLSSTAKHKTDSLALAIYLVRHVAGQRGVLVLAGEFSQAAICEDLGWGATNRARLKRALADLEALNFVVSELRDNNTVVLHVVAEILNQVDPQKPREGRKESSQPPCKVSLQPPCEKSSQASHAGAFSSFSYKNKNTELNLLLSEARDIPDKQTQRKDDDVENLLDLYRSELKKAFTAKTAAAFAATYLANGRPFDLVAEGFRTLAAHPKLRSDTASPNAVWELDFMQRKARDFDQRLRAYFHEQSRRGASNEAILAAIAQVARDTGIATEALQAHFEADLAMLEAERAAERTKWASWNANSDRPNADIATCDSENPLPPAEESILIDARKAPKSEEFPSLSECLAQPLAPTPSQSDSPIIECDTGTLKHSVSLDEIPAKQSEAGTLEGTQSEGQVNRPMVFRETTFPSMLGGAKSLAELRRLIAEALQSELPNTVRGRLKVLAELAALERTSFEMLQRIVTVHTFSASSDSGMLQAAA